MLVTFTGPTYFVLVGKVIILVVCAVMALEIATPASPQPTATAESFLIWVTPKSQRLGDFRVRRDPTYQGAIDVFGEADQCRLINQRRVGVAVWRSLGFRINVTTLGYPGPNATPCNAPDSHQIDRIMVTGRRWRTRSGLRVGASVATLRRLYPKAERRQGWYGGYWLVTSRERCVIGICETQYATVPHLVAKIRGGWVSAFVFPVGAQGE
jgi:hypothetical protein